MITEVGHFALVLALVVAAAQGTLPLIGAHRGIESWTAIAKPAAVVQFILLTIAFLALMQAFVVSDFSVLNVFQNSHTEKPLLYKISGVWGNHEGSLLLWVLILALFGAAVAVFGTNLPPGLRARVIAVQGLVGVGFLLFLLFTSNPFTRLIPAPFEGRGLNPLLQDPGLAFHPPFLYLGYVGFSVAFSFAIAALLEGRLDAAWARWVRPWTLAAWMFLTVGIGLGSWWAYYELGWGGWWFWDPVENASFMPWLAGTALLHSAIVVEKRDTLKAWTVLLAILAFSLSLLGTFIVRSGVLNSVHSFASDPTRGLFILGFLVLVTGGSLTLFAIRAPVLKSGGLFAPVSREGALVFNNLLLASALATVLLGTLYPMLLDAVSGEKVTVGPPYFNATFGPLMVPLLALMAVGPLIPWKRADLGAVLSRLKFMIAVTAVAALAVWYFQAGGPVLAILGMALGVWLVAGAVAELALRLKFGRASLHDTLARARNLPRSAYGAALAHGGVGLVLLGITGSLAWQVESLQVMAPGTLATVGPYEFEFLGARGAPGPNYSAVKGTFRISRAGREIGVMEAETRDFTTPPMTTTEAGTRPTAGGDLYAVIGEPDGRGGFATRLYYKPLINLLWLGGLVMVLGALVSLSDRRHRVGAPARKRSRSPVKAAPLPSGA